MNELPRLDDLHCFKRIIDLGSISAAADDLESSQPTVSRCLARLERQLGVVLAHRSSRRLRPTEAGIQLAEEARTLLEAMQSAIARVRGDQAEPMGLLRLDLPSTFGRLHLRSALQDIHRRFPGLSLEVSYADRRINLIEQGIDLAVRIGTLADSSLRSRLLGECRLPIVAAPEYLRRVGEPASPREISDHECLIYTGSSPSDRWRLEALDGSEGIDVPLHGRIRTDSGETLRELALDGLGLASLPSWLIGPDLEAGRLTRVLGDWRRPGLEIRAIYPPGRFVALKVRVTIDLLVEHFAVLRAEHPGWV